MSATHQCNQESRITAIETTGGETHRLVLDIHKRLVLGNGTPSVMVRLDRVERLSIAAVWVVGGVVLAGLIAGLGAIFEHTWTRTVGG
jgi:hypothetical protein